MLPPMRSRVSPGGAPTLLGVSPLGRPFRSWRASVLCLALLLGCGGEEASELDGSAGDAAVADAAADAVVADAAVADLAVADAARDGPPTDAELAPDVEAFDAEVEPDARAPRTCTFAAAQGEQTVDTWRGQVGQIGFTVEGLPDPGLLDSALLRFTGYDFDHPGEEGWLSVNGGPRVALPADEANDNQAVELEFPVELVAGTNRIDFFAFDRPDGAYFRVSALRLVVRGPIDCPAEPEPGRVPNAAPLGVSAFAGLSPEFPRAGLFEILAALDRPFTSLLLDFAPVYEAHGLRMYGPGARGQRPVNAAQLDALAGFIEAYAEATPEARSRHLQIYLFNGPGIRRAGYARAFDLDPGAFDRGLREDQAVRADVRRYAEAMVARLRPLQGVEVRLVPVLEDDLDQGAAEALATILREAGWQGPIGRNPCACARGDRARVGDFQENHPHSVAATQQRAAALSPPDSLSNDGWAFATDLGDGRLPPGQVPELVRTTQARGVWFHLWYDPLQGYPVPANGPRDLRFDDPPARVLSWLAAGVQ